jgi:hypothetical protein
MIKNRTFLLLVANLSLGTFIIINLENEESIPTTLSSKFSEATGQMNQIDFFLPSIDHKIVLQKDQASWQIKRPVTWPVEPISIANFISKLSHLESTFISHLQELGTKGEVPQDYGFDENSSSIHIKGNRSELFISLGSLTRDHSGCYLLLDDQTNQTIWRVPRSILNLFEQPLGEWTKMTFLDIPLYSIDALHIHAISADINQSTSLIKNSQGWNFSYPSNSQANASEVSLLLHQLVSEKVIGFADPSLSSNRQKILELKVEAMGQVHTISFHLASETNSAKLLVEASAYPQQPFYVQSDFLDNFKDIRTKLREKILFSLDINRVNRIKISDNNHTLTIRKNQQSEWIGMEDNGTNSFSFQSDSGVIRKFIHELNLVEVSTFTHFNPDSKTLDTLGFSNPRFRLEVEQEDNTKSNILISKSNSETSLWNTYATDQAFIGLVDTPWNKLLSVNAMDFQDRKLFPAQFRPDRIDLKTINNLNVISTLTYESKGEAFERFLGFQADYFVDLSYNREGIWVNGDWLPWMYSICFQRSKSEDSTPIEFNLTDRIGGTKWYAGSEELGMVFNLPISIIDELGKELHPSNNKP